MLFGSYRSELLDEVCVNDEVMYIAERIKLEKEGTRLQDMRNQLKNVRSKFKKTF